MSHESLAKVYRSNRQGAYAQALPWYKKCLSITSERLEEDHPDVARSLNNLAGLYCEQGRYVDAEPLYRQALTIAEQVLGKNHPTTNIIRANYEQVKERSIGGQ